MSKVDFTTKVYTLSKPAGKVRAFASLVIGEIIEVKGFKIIEGAKGLFVSPPSKAVEKDGETKYYDDVLFLDKDTDSERPVSAMFKEISDSMLAEYQGKSSGGGNTRAAAAKANTTHTSKSRSGPFSDSPAFA